MSYRIILVVLLVVSISALSKDINFPQAVKESFAKLYPKVSDAKWEMEEKNKYEAEFKDNGIKVTVCFNKKGKLLETETEVQTSELQANIAKIIKEKFAGFKIGDASRIVDKKGNITYEVDIIKGDSKFEVLFDKDGKFLKETPQEKEESEKDED